MSSSLSRCGWTFGRCLQTSRTRCCKSTHLSPLLVNRRKTPYFSTATSNGNSKSNSNNNDKALPGKALATGLLAGGAGSLVGMGGGFVAIPIMTSRWMGLSQHQAHATSLFAVFATGSAGSASFALAGNVDWPAAAAIACGGIVTANMGARLAENFPAYVLKGLMGIFMLSVGPLVYFKPWLLERLDLDATQLEEGKVTSDFSTRVPKLLLVGGAVGIFCGVFGVGGGAVTVPAVSLCLPESSHCDALGTSLAAMVLPAISGLVRHSQTGAIIQAAALPLAIGTGLASFLTGHFIALEVDENSLRVLFAATMVVMGGRTLQSALKTRLAAVTSK